MPSPAESKKILLTGASSGIGKAVATALCQAGYQVWGTARDASRVPEIEGLHPVALDLCDPESLQRAIDQAERESGGIDILINNAGNGIFGPAALFEGNQLEQQFRTLVSGPFQLATAFLPRMQARGGGIILNVTSVGAQFPIPFLGPYNACKAALSMLTDSLAIECRGRGVAFIDLRPGDIRTDFNNAINKVPIPENSDWQAPAASGWDILEKEMQQGPPPEIVANRVLALIRKGKPGRYTVGNFFQARLAPLLERLLPRSLILWGLAKYYRPDYPH